MFKRKTSLSSHKWRLAKIICISIFIISIILAAFAFFFLSYPNVEGENTLLVIPKDATYQQVCDSLKTRSIIRNNFTFSMTAKILGYDKQVFPGRYTIQGGEGNYKLIRFLQRGQHYPVKFTFNNLRTKEQLVEKVGSRFLFEPHELDKLLNDRAFLAQYGLTAENCVSIFFPDTYEFYFDITAEDFFNKFYDYYSKFWNEERLALAAEIGISPADVSTIASIVEEENHKGGEKAMIAGVYINRIKRGWKLEADPTLKFAMNDFSAKRVTDEFKTVDSPYNTYMYAGIPPGPIRIPEKSTLDSVLHYAHHNYMFMCAKEDFSGRHNFARTLDEHNLNAYKYRNALNRKRIYR